MIAADDSGLLTHLKSQLAGESRRDEQADIFNVFPSIIYESHLKKKEINSFNQQLFPKRQGCSLDQMNGWKERTGELTFKDAFTAVTAEVKQLETLAANENQYACLSLSHKRSVHLPVHKNYFKIVIEDDGIRLEKQYADGKFQFFRRLQCKSEYLRSGIALASCKKIAENYNGLLFSKSIPDTGASLTIILPE
jgi:light-regulated signal transduction histidine kinase (bacteriophytochrome)